MTSILSCTCQHSYQDAIYGQGKRLHNYAPKELGTGGWRCTVCGKVKKNSSKPVLAAKGGAAK